METGYCHNCSVKRCDDGDGLLSRLIALERGVVIETGYCHV